MQKSEQTLMMMTGLLSAEAPERQELINDMMTKIRAIVDGTPDSIFALSVVLLEHEVEADKKRRLAIQLGARK